MEGEIQISNPADKRLGFSGRTVGRSPAHNLGWAGPSKLSMQAEKPISLVRLGCVRSSPEQASIDGLGIYQPHKNLSVAASHHCQRRPLPSTS